MGMRAATWALLGVLGAALVTSGADIAGQDARPVTSVWQPAETRELWEAVAVESRDLFHGPGGAALAPKPGEPFVFVKSDKTGYSKGFDVTARDGTAWAVKLGPEAQTEVVSSRLLWAVGYHQPATYYLSRWTMTGQLAGIQEEARFRREPATETVVGDWSWHENPFSGSQALKGLVVANLLLNNWDWKTTNNRSSRFVTADPRGGCTSSAISGRHSGRRPTTRGCRGSGVSAKVPATTSRGSNRSGSSNA